MNFKDTRTMFLVGLSDPLLLTAPLEPLERLTELRIGLNLQPLRGLRIGCMGPCVPESAINVALEPEASAGTVGGGLPARQQPPVAVLPPVSAKGLPADGGRLLRAARRLGLCLRTAGLWDLGFTALGFMSRGLGLPYSPKAASLALCPLPWGHLF